MGRVARRRRPRLLKNLTRADRGRFAFLLKHLSEGGPDLETALERCKAADVPLDRLSEYLLFELAEASNPNTVLALKAMRERVDEGVKRFRQARRLLAGLPIALGSQTSMAHPEALLEILDAVGDELLKARELAGQMFAGRRDLEARRGARATGRKRQEHPDYESLGLVRDDVRELRQAVRYVARHAPMRFGEGVKLTRVPDDRCAACGNPAARLFRRRA